MEVPGDVERNALDLRVPGMHMAHEPHATKHDEGGNCREVRFTERPLGGVGLDEGRPCLVFVSAKARRPAQRREIECTPTQPAEVQIEQRELRVSDVRIAAMQIAVAEAPVEPAR